MVCGRADSTDPPGPSRSPHAFSASCVHPDSSKNAIPTPADPLERGTPHPTRVATTAWLEARVPSRDGGRDHERRIRVRPLRHRCARFAASRVARLHVERRDRRRGRAAAGRPLLGLYQGVPLTQAHEPLRGRAPDKITIYRGPLERLYGSRQDTLQREVRRVVLHEIAHHFGISDERLVEIDRY